MRLTILLLSFIIFQSSFSQSPIDQFNNAKSIFDKGNFKECIGLLGVIEKQVGPNPKIYSLYVYAYASDKDYVNAKIALNKFKKLVGSNTSESIKAVLDLEKEIDAGVNNAEITFTQTAERKAMENADKIIAATASPKLQKAKLLQEEFTRNQFALLSNANADELPEYIRSLPDEAQRNVIQELRQTKLRKQHVGIQFTDRSLKKVEVYTFTKYDAYGLKMYQVRYTWSENNPEFSEAMLSEEYAYGISKMPGATITEGRLIGQVGTWSKTESHTFVMDQGGRRIPEQISYSTWANNYYLVKDSVISYSDNRWNSKWLSEIKRDDSQRIVSYTRRQTVDNQVVDYSNQWYTYLRPGYGFISREDFGKDYTDKYGVEYWGSTSGKIERYIDSTRYNRYGDLVLEKSRNTNNNGFEAPTTYSRSYDNYGNEIAETTYYRNADGKISTVYFQHNFLRYHDDYHSGLGHFYATRGLREYSSKNYELALTQFSRSLEIEPKNATLINQMAYSYYYLGKFETAIEQLHKALEVDPSYANAYDSMGELYFMKGDTTAAVMYYKKAAEMGYQHSIEWLQKNGYQQN